MAAFQRLPEDLQRAHPLVIAGPDGDMVSPERSLLESLKGRGLAYETGYVPDSLLPSLMRTAVLLCYPSLYEGFGLPPIEAAACGTPVVCSNVASLPEVMADAAVYVDPTSPEAIADGLRRVIEDPVLRESLRRSGRTRARVFTWERCADLTLAVYQAALG
jgi:alpha-1,3-rhamnosyl/mannosyltransferase